MQAESAITSNIGDWRIALAYVLLIGLYLIILKLMMNMIQELTKKHRTQRSIVDVDIRRESANARVDERAVEFDFYALAVAIVRAVMIVLSVLAILCILYFKLGIWLTLLTIVVISAATWGFLRWRDVHETTYHYYEQKLNRYGGNVLTVALLGAALICVAVGLLLLPT